MVSSSHSLYIGVASYERDCLWVDSVDDTLMVLFVIFPQNTDFDISSNLHEISKPFFWEKKENNISKCHLLTLLPSMLSIKAGSAAL